MLWPLSVQKARGRSVSASLACSLFNRASPHPRSLIAAGEKYVIDLRYCDVQRGAFWGGKFEYKVINCCLVFLISPDPEGSGQPNENGKFNFPAPESHFTIHESQLV
jgi:hypothetical protein